VHLRDDPRSHPRRPTAGVGSKLHDKSIRAAFADSVEFYAEEGRISFR